MSMLQRHCQQHHWPLLKVPAKHPCIVEPVTDVRGESQVTYAEAHGVTLSKRHRF